MKHNMANESESLAAKKAKPTWESDTDLSDHENMDSGTESTEYYRQMYKDLYLQTRHELEETHEKVKELEKGLEQQNARYLKYKYAFRVLLRKWIERQSKLEATAKNPPHNASPNLVVATKENIPSTSASIEATISEVMARRDAARTRPGSSNTSPDLPEESQLKLTA